MKNRKQFLVDRALQYRLGGELMIMVLLVLTVPFAYYASFLVESQSVAGVRTHGVVGGLLRYHWPSLILFFLAYLGIVYVFVVFYSHRIAGPVHRLCRALDDVAEGRMTQDVRLRQGDYFENLGRSINRATGDVTMNLVELKAAATTLSEITSARGDRDVHDHVAKIRRILDRYTVVPASR